EGGSHWPAFLTVLRDDGEGHCRAPGDPRGFERRRQYRFWWQEAESPRATLGDLGARQGPSQHLRECEKCELIPGAEKSTAGRDPAIPTGSVAAGNTNGRKSLLSRRRQDPELSKACPL